MSHHRYPYHQLPADLLDQLPVLPRDYGPDHSRAGAHVCTYDDFVKDCTMLTTNLGIDAARRATLHKGLSGVQPAAGSGGLIVLEHAAGAINSMSGYSTASKLRGVIAQMDLLTLCDASQHAIYSSFKTFDALAQNQQPAPDCACGGQKDFGDVSQYTLDVAATESFVAERQLHKDGMVYATKSADEAAAFFTDLTVQDNLDQCRHSMLFGKKYKFSKVPTASPFCPVNVEIWVIRALPQDSDFLLEQVMKRDHVDVVVDLLSVCSTHNPVGFLHQLTHVFQTVPNKYKLVLLEHGYSQEVSYIKNLNEIVSFSQHRLALACSPCLNLPRIFDAIHQQHNWVNTKLDMTGTQLLIEVFPTKGEEKKPYDNDYGDMCAPEKIPHFFYFEGSVDNTPQ